MKKSKKTFKRALAVVLSVLMVGSSLPLANIAASAASQQDLEILNQYISQYETKMNGTIYRNMKPAYDKYIEALKAKDAFVSGKNTNQNLAQLAADFEVAYNNMTIWDPKAPTPSTVTPSFRSDTKDTAKYPNAVYKDGVTHQGLLYAPHCAASNGTVASSALPNALTEWKVCYPTYVAVYDGYNTPKMPVMSIGKNTASANKHNFGAYPTAALNNTADSSIINLENYWRAPIDTSDETNKNVPNLMDFTYYFINGNKGETWHINNGTGFNEATGKQGNQSEAHCGPTYVKRYRRLPWDPWTHYERYQANVMVLSPNFTMGADQYSQAINETYWYTSIGGNADANGNTTNTESGYLTAAGHPIYLLNIKTLNDSAIEYAKKLDLAYAEKYTIDSANYSALLGKLDAATGFNLAADYSETASQKTADVVAKKATEIQNVKTAMDTATMNAKQDGDRTGYVLLRTAIKDNKSTVEAGQADYTKDTWDAYVAAYNAGVAKMAGLPTSQAGYTDYADAKTLADNIASTKAALKTSIVKVDTVKLEEVIENANVAIVTKNFLTSTPASAFNTNFNALNTAITNAKNEIWVGVDNYPSEGTKVKDTPENQAKVANHIDAISKAIVKLQINYDAPVPKAANKSMNYYLGEAAKLVQEDYANFDTVTAAVDAANAFKQADHHFKSEKGNVQAEVRAYVEKTRALYIALINLQPSFSKLVNGTVVKAGTELTTTVSDTHQKGWNTWQLNVGYQNEKVIFKTTHEAKDFNLGSMNLEFTARHTKFPAVLDSININDLTDNNKLPSGVTMNSAKDGEITSGRNGKKADIEMNQNQLNAFPGLTDLAATSADGKSATLSINNIKVASTAGTEQGKDVAGKIIALDTVYDWKGDLSRTDGKYGYVGGIIAPKGTTTRIVADQIISVPGEAAPTIAAGTLNASTVPTASTFAPQNIYFGAVAKWQMDVASANYDGYGHDRKPWSPSVTIIDVSYLFDLINECNGLVPEDYTPATYEALRNALVDANGELSYGSLSTEAITSECVTRYNNLWTAYTGLEKAKTHTHEYGAWVGDGKQAATHTKTCKNSDGLCDAIEVTEKCTPGAVQTEKVVKASCGKAGSHDEVTYCTVCKQELTRKTVTDPATGNHTWGNWESNNDGKNHIRHCTDPNCSKPAASETQACTPGKTVIEKKVAPTCTKAGSHDEVKYCTVCNQELSRKHIVDKATGHKVANYPFVAPTENATGYIGGTYCSVDNEVLTKRTPLDAKAYFAQLKVVEANKTNNQYTAASIKEYTDACNKAMINTNLEATFKVDNPQVNVIDKAVTALDSAKSLLKIKPEFSAFNVSLQVVTNGVAAPAKVVARDQAYSTPYSISAADVKGNNFIERWEICDESTQGTTPVYSTADSIEFTVTSNTTVKVYLSQKPADGKNYTKVTLYNEFGKVYNISYVEDTSSIDLSQPVLNINGKQIKAPAVPFYNFSKWVVASAPTGEYNLKPAYTFIDSSASYSQIIGVNGALINGVDQFTSRYDAKISLTGGQAYAIVKNGDVNQVLTYINSPDAVHVPHNAKVYIAAVNKADVTNNATSAVTGTLVVDKSATYGEGKRGAAFNCMFNLPANASVVEYGAVGTGKANIAADESQFQIGTQKVFKFKSDRCSAMNEYTITFISSFKPSTVFYGRSYVIYKDATGQQHTVYGNIEQITL